MRDCPPKVTPRYRRAVFLDRDGTINEDTDYPHNPKTLRLTPRALEGIAVLAGLYLDIIVVSNQAGIALGRFTQSQMSAFNREVLRQVTQAGGRIDAFYFCPHLEAKDRPEGQPGCGCAKPSPGMLQEAARDFRIAHKDLAKSFMIGDRSVDIAAGQAVGCRTILVETIQAVPESNPLAVKPDYRAPDLYEAAALVASLLNREVTGGPSEATAETSRRLPGRSRGR